MRRTLHRTRSRVIALGVGCSVISMLMLASVMSAAAGPAYSIDTYYFSNASLTKQVGETHLYCYGGFRKKGTVPTPYTVTYTEPCY